MPRRQVTISIVVVACLVVVAVIALACVVLLGKAKESGNNGDKDPHSGKHGGVASDSYVCSKVGVDAMKDGGTATDATIASMFCLGLVHPQSSGIGGGGFMLIYQRAKKRAKFLDFREPAPAAATVNMFANNTEASKRGVLSIAVPGEVLAMYNAWQAYGKLPWKRLIQPTVDLARNGYEIDEPLSIIIRDYNDSLLMEKGFREVFYHSDGSPRKQGEVITDPVFAKTLTELGEDPFSFYNGSIAKEMVSDIRDRRGILTEDDLKNFEVKERNVLEDSMANGDRLYTTSAPSSGSTMIMMLNILRGFNFTSDALSGKNIVRTWHLILEAFKFAFAYRPFLGDPDFYPRVEESMKLQTNVTYAERLRRKIWVNTTHNSSYYGGFYENPPDYGTTQVSVVGPSGDAVSVTSTLGYTFGAKIRSYRTGIVYNNHMGTFSLPNVSKSYQPKSSEANHIAPGKRSVSTACPTIVVNKNGSVRMVVGASGGMRITSGVATVLMNKLWFNLSLEDSITRPRLHHQLYPNHFNFRTKKKYRMEQSVIDGLKSLGHKAKGITRYCAIQAVYRDESGQLGAMSDPRKTGVAVVY